MKFKNVLSAFAIVSAFSSLPVLASEINKEDDITKIPSSKILHNLKDKEWIEGIEGKKFSEEILNKKKQKAPSLQDKKKMIEAFSLKKQGIIFELIPMYDDPFHLEDWMTSPEPRKFKETAKIEPYLSMNEFLRDQSSGNKHKFSFVLKGETSSRTFLLNVDTSHRRSQSLDKNEEDKISLSSKGDINQGKKSGTQVNAVSKDNIQSLINKFDQLKTGKDTNHQKINEGTSQQQLPVVPPKPQYLKRKYSLQEKNNSK